MTDYPTKPILHTKRKTTYKLIFDNAVLESAGPLSEFWSVYIADHNGQVWLSPTKRMRETNAEGNKRFISLTPCKDAAILETLVLNADRGKPPKPRWEHVRSLMSISQEEAIILCLRFGLAPEKIVGDTP